jgi:uncharacterized phage infection (PIP) family protein YhgE
MSYAQAAGSSGPIGAEKLPQPAQVETTEEPQGHIEVVDTEQFEDLKNKTKTTLKKVSADLKETVDQAEKEFDKLEKESKSVFNDIASFINKKLVELNGQLNGTLTKLSKSTSQAVSSAYAELQNPVVLVQTVIGLTGIAAGYVAYVDRHRIRSDNNMVLGIHASIITGLVLVDGYLFNKYYGRYQKK